MPLSDYVRPQVRVRSIGAGTSGGKGVGSGGDYTQAASVVYTGSRSVWKLVGKPKPYIPTCVAIAVALNSSDSERSHRFVVCAANANDVKSVLECDGITISCVVCADLAPADEVSVRHVVLSLGVGVLILRCAIATKADIVRAVADGRWPNAKVTGNISDDVICPPGYDSKVKIDALRTAYRIIDDHNDNANSNSKSGTTACTGRTRQVITVSSVHTDEQHWRTQLANTISNATTTYTAPTGSKASNSKRSSFFLKMLDL